MSIEVTKASYNDGATKTNVKYVETDEEGHIHLTQDGKNEIFGAVVGSIFDSMLDSLTSPKEEEKIAEEEEQKAVEKEKDPVGDLLFDILGIYLYSKYSESQKEKVEKEEQKNTVNENA